ncbi:MAG: hypothetical protein WCG93_10140 [Paludibacter sp.]
MKATVLKRDKRFELRNDKGLGVQAYGESNDYPQQLMEVVDPSGTGKSCVGVYAKFISGKGFTDNDFYRKVINRLGQTNDYIIDQISKDYAQFGGFALHLNFNANFQIVELQYVPFEQVRFSAINVDTGHFDKLATHHDWGKRFLLLRKWKKEDITFFNFFDPDPEEIQAQVEEAGGWANYTGQILYFSNAGPKTYPLPIFDSVLTDMNTEEGIANVSNRNARSNFLTAGMFINYTNDNNNAVGDDGETKTEDSSAGVEKAVKEFQGDEKAGKIMYVELEEGDTKPEFISFKGTNYDKEFNVTLASSQANIGKAFNQPPILRAEAVGANFGADLMKNAYNYYNSVIENERLNVERVFTSIFQHWFEPTAGDYSIIPLSYDVETSLAERLGKDNLAELFKIIDNAVYSVNQKRGMAKTLFNLSEEEINSLIPLP